MKITPRSERKEKSMRKVTKKKHFLLFGIIAMLCMSVLVGCGKEEASQTAENAITCVDDIEGKNIGVQIGTTGDIYASDYEGDEAGTVVTRFNKGADAIQALLAGKIDCVVIDSQPAKEFVEANEGLTILDTEYAVEDYAIALNKDNTELLDKVNAALKELTDDGTIQSILDKYITAE